MRREQQHVSCWAVACVLLAAGAFVVGCTDDKLAGGSTDGPRLFEEACARCHGPEGVPTKGMQTRSGVKPLNTPRVKGMTDDQLFDQIRNVSSNRMMPAFQGAMSDDQMKALVGHIRTLQGESADL